MNKSKINPFKIIFFLLAVIFISSSFINNLKDDDYDFYEFKNKSYYSELFNSAQRNALSDANDMFQKGESEMLKAEDNFKKAEGYEKLDEDFGGKNSKKAIKYKKKGTKYALKAYNYFLNAINKKFRVYTDRLGQFTNENSKKHLKAEELSIKARELFLNGSDLIQKENEKDKNKALKTYQNAFDLQMEALQLQETAFMIFMDDPKVKYDKNKDDIVTNDENTNNNSKQVNTDYEPGKDPNMYISKEESIVSELDLSEEDRMKLDDAGDKRAYADILSDESDQDYNKIDRIRNEAESTDDEYEKNLKFKMAAGLEDVLLDKMIKAAGLYYEADKMKYEVYKKYLPSARTSGGFNEGQKHEKNAEEFFTDASRLYNKTMFYSGHKSGKYIQLMNAVQTQLSAIQEQENAFSVYFKFDVIPLEEINIVDNNESGKTSDNKKNLYDYDASFVYSKEQPDPIALIHKDGIIFKVQIGIFKNLLSTDQYGEYSPISFDTFKNNSYKRFFLGEYRSYKSAEYVLNQIKTKGLSDPFIVSYVNGVRKSATFGLAQIIRDDEFERIEAEEMSYLTGMNKNIPDEDIKTDNIMNVKTVNGLAYFIQLGSFSTEKSKEDFGTISTIYTEQSGSLYKYMTGKYVSYKEAKNEVDQIKSKGFPEAFVTVYNNGNKISIADASKLVNNQNTNINTNLQSIIFSVQLGVFSKKLLDNDIEKFKPITDSYTLKYKINENGMYIYYIGEYSSYEEASNVKNKIKSMGQDGFVIAFQNGEKISAKKALDILKNK
jgi:hypothetical protein